MAARMPMMTTTISNSMRVKPRRLDQGIVGLRREAFGAHGWRWFVSAPCELRSIGKAMPGPLRRNCVSAFSTTTSALVRWCDWVGEFAHIALDRALCNTDKCDAHSLTRWNTSTYQMAYASFVASQLSPTPTSTTSGTD